MYYYVIIKFLKVDCTEKNLFIVMFLIIIDFLEVIKNCIVKEIFSSYFLLNLDIE